MGVDNKIRVRPDSVNGISSCAAIRPITLSVRAGSELIPDFRDSKVPGPDLDQPGAVLPFSDDYGINDARSLLRIVTEVSLLFSTVMRSLVGSSRNLGGRSFRSGHPFRSRRSQG